MRALFTSARSIASEKSYIFPHDSRISESSKSEERSARLSLRRESFSRDCPRAYTIIFHHFSLSSSDCLYFLMTDSISRVVSMLYRLCHVATFQIVSYTRTSAFFSSHVASRDFGFVSTPEKIRNVSSLIFAHISNSKVSASELFFSAFDISPVREGSFLRLPENTKSLFSTKIHSVCMLCTTLRQSLISSIL